MQRLKGSPPVFIRSKIGGADVSDVYQLFFTDVIWM